MRVASANQARLPNARIAHEGKCRSCPRAARESRHRSRGQSPCGRRVPGGRTSPRDRALRRFDNPAAKFPERAEEIPLRAAGESPDIGPGLRARPPAPSTIARDSASAENRLLVQWVQLETRSCERRSLAMFSARAMRSDALEEVGRSVARTRSRSCSTHRANGFENPGAYRGRTSRCGGSETRAASASRSSR